MIGSQEYLMTLTHISCTIHIIPNRNTKHLLYKKMYIQMMEVISNPKLMARDVSLHTSSKWEVLCYQSWSSSLVNQATYYCLYSFLVNLVWWKDCSWIGNFHIMYTSRRVTLISSRSRWKLLVSWSQCLTRAIRSGSSCCTWI